MYRKHFKGFCNQTHKNVNKQEAITAKLGIK